MRIILLLLSLCAPASAQVATTNFIRIQPSSRLVWDSPAAGLSFSVYSSLSTNILRTTNTFVQLSQISTNIKSGTATFMVTSVDQFGTESDPATLSTNLSQAPPFVLRLRLEASVVP